MTAKVVSFINLKGGVGKSTLALTIGEFLAFRYPYRKVLLIDLDAQSNLSYALVSRDSLEKLRTANKTVYHMFRAALDNQSWDITTSITKDCSNISGNTHLSTLVCTPDLGQLDEYILNMLEGGATIQVDFRRILLYHLTKVLDEFDYIIIDCPPSLSTITSNAIIASDYFVAPILPEYLSLEGLGLIQTRIAQLKGRLSYGNQIAIDFAGSIVNKVDWRRRDHKEWADEVFTNQTGFFQPFKWWLGDIKPLYIVTEYEYPFAVRSREWGYLQQKYTYGAKRRKNPLGTALQRGSFDYYNIYDRLSDLANEFVKRCS